MPKRKAKAAAGRDPERWAPRVAVVGGGVAGYSAAGRLRRAFPRAEVHVYDRNRWHHYSACGMTFALEGLFPLDRTVMQTPDQCQAAGLEVHEGVTVESLDLDARTLHLSGGREDPYDVLVLATGRRAFVPPVPGHDLPGVWTLSNYGDAERVLELAATAKRAVVVGGGAIGLETTVALRAGGANVTVVEVLPHLLPQMLDEDIARPVRDHLEARRIRVLTDAKVDRFLAGPGGGAEAVEVGGERFAADLIVVAAGVRPEASLADASGLDRGRTGAFATDAHLLVMRGGRPVEGAYAVGDCAEVRHAVTGQPTLSPLASTALYEARSVALHLLDGVHEHRPVVSPAVVVVGGVHAGSVGLTTHAAEQAGLGPWSVAVKDLDRSRYFPGAGELHLKLVGDSGGRLVGAQCVGPRDVKERMNLLAVAISEGMPAERLADVERAFSPAVQLLQDPMLTALDEFVARARDLMG
jgi:NADPH-dependent 2,4-dienoyl-CoA reductase/sulfur reductase-like enzyme